MSGRDKGNRNERKAADQLREQGWMVHKTAGGRFDNDAWDVADLICLKEGQVLLVQVKTNGFDGRQRYEEVWSERKDEFPSMVTFEMWSRYDGQGGPHGYEAAWRKLRFEDDGFVEFEDNRCEAQVGR